jgi:hypothetical protein
MHHIRNRANVRAGSIGHPENRASDYIYQAATIAAALLLLLTVAAV